MNKLIATIIKDFRILLRDKVGLTLMFVMPILLALIITAVQNSTFELVNHNKINLLLCNKDTGDASQQLSIAIKKTGMFNVIQTASGASPEQVAVIMREKDAMAAVIIPNGFSSQITATANNVASNALKNFDIVKDTAKSISKSVYPLTLYYHPALQGSFRESMDGTLKGALQLVESKQIVRTLYLSLNEKEIPDTLENEITNNQIPINQIPVSRDGSRNIPNATQHNIPAWTIFAMFFIVISLGSSVVREKSSGSFIRLKTLPTSYLVALLSKQITYLAVALAQVIVIFSIGAWVFPHIGLPALNLPSDMIGLLIVSLICGWCAVSYAICIGVFAGTQEQANGFGAVSIMILAALGGLLVPSFAMPDSFRTIMKLSPLHWALEAYYGLFLEGGKLKDVLMNILPLFGIAIFIQLITLYGLKRKNLI
ncbi:MAG TPA: ABC transporter permease [Puia sp.]|nr:ABC transporter permease [Puia sp.]